jgi:hypothetical protein
VKRKPRPLCACGCGFEVRKPYHTWRSDCVPRASRVLGGVNARSAFAFKARSARFRAEIDRVIGARDTITREQLLEVCNAVWRLGYQAGFSTRDSRDRRGSGKVAA